MSDLTEPAPEGPEALLRAAMSRVVRETEPTPQPTEDVPPVADPKEE